MNPACLTIKSRADYAANGVAVAIKAPLLAILICSGTSLPRMYYPRLTIAKWVDAPEF